MKILVLGSSGMLGHVTLLYLRSKGYDVVGISSTRKITKDSILLNIEDVSKFNNFLERNKFDIIINCIAVLVKASEENKSKAVFINSYIPHMLEQKYINTTTRIIQVSTDGVFSGNNAPYIESNNTDTQTFYGKSKVLGEIINSKDVTIRGSFIGPDISPFGSGLINWFIMQKGNIYGYENVILNGVTSLEFAKFVEIIIDSPISGVYHLGSKDSYSKFALLCNIKNLFEIDNININPKRELSSNHTIISTMDNVSYKQKSSEGMLLELRDWIVNNRELYEHYFDNIKNIL